MKFKTFRATLAALALFGFSSASADFGVGIKAGTLGVGLEGRWDPPVPWFDVRVGLNQYDYDDDGDYAGINYDATLALDSYYVTGNFKFPLSPLRFTVGAFSNGNELQMASAEAAGIVDIGGLPFDLATIGRVESTTSFSSTAPYAGVGFDFEVFGKAGINLDFGVLWQGDPNVALGVSNFDNLSAAEQALLGPAIEVERAQIEDDVSDYKAWPVVSLGFVYNF